MFSCLYKLIWIQIQRHLLKIQERRRPGLLRLLLRGKGDEGPRGVSLVCVVHVVVPFVPPFLSFLSYPPLLPHLLTPSAQMCVLLRGQTG